MPSPRCSRGTEPCCGARPAASSWRWASTPAWCSITAGWFRHERRDHSRPRVPRRAATGPARLSLLPHPPDQPGPHGAVQPDALLLRLASRARDGLWLPQRVLPPRPPRDLVEQRAVLVLLDPRTRPP